MGSRAFVALFLVVGGCSQATPYGRDGSPPDDDADSGEAPYETCYLPDVEGLDPEEYTMQIRNPECDTTICVHYGGETYCTIRCGEDRDCVDIGRGNCSLHIRSGDAEFIGSYCVPAAIDPRP